jgi:hypothetical protein
LLRGDLGQANAWTARGQRLIRGRDCAERGYLLLPVAEQELRAGHADEAGIGNVYKSETLFLEKVSPFVSVGSLDDATLERVLKRARDLMRRNLIPGPRRTTFGSFAGNKHWVYDRSGQHCLKCDSKIGMRRQGSLQRSTYFCPECQRVVAGSE